VCENVNAGVVAPELCNAWHRRSVTAPRLLQIWCRPEKQEILKDSVDRELKNLTPLTLM